MARISRSVAQRYAAANKKRRKNGQRSPLATSPGRLESDTSTTTDTAAATLTSAVPPAPKVTATSTPLGTRPSATRRTSTNYTEHYRYVWGDIRRIGLLAGSLLTALVLLSLAVR